MLNTIKQIFSPPDFPDNKIEPNFSRIIFVLMAATWAIVAIGLVTTFSLIEDKVFGIIFILIMISMLLTVNFLIQREHLRLGSIVYIFVIWCFATIAIYLGSGTSSPELTLYVVLTIIAGVMLNVRWAGALAILSATVVFGIALLEMNNHPFPHVFIEAPLVRWFNFFLYLFFAITPVYLALTYLSQALHHTQQENKQRKEAEHALRESEERFRILVESSIQGILVHRETVPLFVNDAYAHILGYDSPDEILALPTMVPLIAPYERERLLGYLAARVRGDDAPTHYEFDSICKDGSVVTLQQIVTTIQWGGETAVMGAIIDITEQKQTEIALQESEARYHSVVEAMAEGVVMHQASGEILFANSAAEHILGLTMDQMMGRTSLDPRWRTIHEDGTLFPGETHPAMITLRTGEPVRNVVMGVYKPDGNLSWISVNSQPLQPPDETSPYGVVATFHDITELKQAEQALKEQEAHYRALFENLPIPVFTKDRQGVYTSSNVENLHYWADNPVGKTDFELLDHEVARALRDTDQRVMKNGEVVTKEEVLIDTPLGDRQVLTRKVPLLDNDNKVIGILGASIDITERKEIEISLKNSEARYRSLFEQANDAIFLNTIDDVIIDVNRRACEMLGYSREELLTMTVSDLQAPEIRQQRGEVIKYEIEHFAGVPFETVDIHKDGTRIAVEVNTSLIVDNQNQQLALSIVRNISQRKQAEQALRESEERLNGIVISAMDAIIVIDEMQKIVLFNPTAERVFGYTAEEIIGKPLTNLMPERFRHGHERHVHAFGLTGLTNRLMGQDALYGLRSDGEEFPIEASISQSMINEEQYFTAILRDITKRIELEEQFYQAQKMEAIGLLAGGIAHDFNNLLTPIMVYADLGMMDLTREDRVYEYLQQIEKTASRAKQLTQQILALSQKQLLVLETLELNAVVHDISNLLQRVIGENILLEMNLQDNLPFVQADANQLGQILMNLAVNARDAMPNGGVLEIKTRFVRLNEVLEGLPAAIPPNSYIVLSVRDAGVGMGEEVKHHLFEPFFTTKESGRGTGLGLSTVHSIVQRHHGHIQFDSQIGEGTVFKIYLPVTREEKVEVETPALSPVEDVLVTGTVLIVEDEISVRIPLTQVLLLKGYRVLEAINGEEALQIAFSCDDNIHLLLTDMMMPDMNGYELHQKLIELFPAIKVLYMSGYSGDFIEQLTLSTQVDFLQKPFKLQQLTEKVNKIINNNS